MKDEVIPHVLVAEEEVGVTPEAGHQGTLQDDITCVMIVGKKWIIIDTPGVLTNEFLLAPKFWWSIPSRHLPQGASLRHCGQVICEQAVVFSWEGQLSCWS